VAIVLSMALHFMILYVPFFANIFQIVPLNFDEWMAVLAISAPVMFFDELLKFVSRTWVVRKSILLLFPCCRECNNVDLAAREKQEAEKKIK
jgi:Ca2+ transporting ATPase